MKNIVKPFLLSALLTLFSFSNSNAQTFEIIDSNEFVQTFDVMVDSCLSNLNIDSIPTGLLLEKAFQTADVGYFQGTLTDSNIADHFTWRCIYGTLRRAFMDTTQAFDSLGTAMDTIQHHYLDSGLIPISVINYQYATIKPNAIDDSLLYFNGIRLFDKPGPHANPYETHTCFVAAAGTIEAGGNAATFILPAYLYTSNDTRTVDFIEVDFANGEGWQSGHWGDKFTVEYDTNKDTNYVVTVRIHFTNSDILASHFNYSVHFLSSNDGYGSTPDTSFTIMAANGYGDGANNKGFAHVSIYYGCGHSKLMKPFIVVEGYNSPRMVYNATKGSTGWKPSNGANIYFDYIKKANGLLGNELQAEGYDFIYVDFLNNGDYIQRNAYTLETVINTLNTIKTNNGSSYKNVVMGVSLGGLVSHYALAHMTSNSQNHDIKLYITIDSPHKGANIPIGIQALVFDMFYVNTTQPGFRQKLSELEAEMFEWDMLSLNGPAARQMLIHQYNYTNSLYSSFYSELNGLGAIGPSNCKIIAISNGSTGGSALQMNEAYTTTMYANSKLLDIWRSRNGFGFDLDVWAVPDVSLGQRKVYDGLFEHWILGKRIYRHRKIVTANGCQAIDNAPGGRMLIANEGTLIESIYSLKNSTKCSMVNFYNTYCLIPSLSGIEATGSNFYCNINGSTCTSVFDRFKSTDNQTPYSLQSNENHPALTDKNTIMLIQELFSHIPTEIDNGYIYNFGDTTNDRIQNIEVKTGGVLAINKNWSTGYNLKSTSSGPFPTDNSLFKVATQSSTTCTSTPSVIQINDGAYLEIGDAGSNREGELYISNGSTLILKQGANLHLYNNSKLVIESGAQLEIEEGVNILLDDATSELEIRGSLVLYDNVDFNFTGNGNFKFSCSESEYCNITNGANCTFNLTGANREDKILEVTGKGLHLQDLENFAVTTGSIELGDNTELVIDKSLHLDLVKITQTENNTEYHQGITIHSQQGSDEVTLTDCLFEYAETGLTKSSTCNLSLLTLETTAFANCSTGLYTNGNACNLSEVRFDDCITNGWLAQDMTATSNAKTYADGNGTAINYAGNSSANLYVYESTFANNTLAVSATGAHILAAQCNHFVSNTNDVYKSSGSLYLDGSHGITPAGGGSTVYGGNNTFDNTATYSINMSSVSNLYVQGQNLFTYSVTPTKIFTGTLSGSTQALDNNQWSVYDGSTTQTSMYANMWAVVSVGWTDTYDWTGTACSSYWNGYIAIPSIFSTPESTIKSASEKTTFILYPNPTNKLLHVQCSTPNTNYTLKAIDMTGRIIYLHPSTRSTNTQSFDVSNLAAGLYQVMVEQNSVVLAKQKIVISR